MSTQNIGFSPATEKELYDAMILAKRDLVTAGLRWSSESPMDSGIALLKVASHMGGLITQYQDSRVGQNYLIYAKDDEAVHATCRGMGYKIKGAIASKIVVLITTTAAQTIPAGAKITKQLTGGTSITFELLEDVVFIAAGSKYAYALQGETKYTVFTGDNTEYQQCVISDYPIAYASMVVLVGSNLAVEVADFINSGSEDWHYTVEYDYTGQPTIWWGDGVFGKKPGNGAQITVAYRTCDGVKGNVAPGEMNFVNNYANVASVENQAPSVAILKKAISAGVVTVEVEDDGAIVGFRDSGIAYIDEDNFSYTNIFGNVFQGVTGLENAHAAGDEVTYTPTYTYGVNKETNREAKISAIRKNRIKTSANSLLDYNYLCSLVPGVARVKSLITYNIIEMQVVPADGGIPSDNLKDVVLAYITPRKNPLHTTNILNPKYVYIDIVVEIAPGPGRSFTHDVKPGVLVAIQDYLDPLKKDPTDMYFLNGWGNLLKKNYLESKIFDLENESLVGDVEITTFKRSSTPSGNNNVQLALDEIAHVGSVTITQKDVNALVETGSQQAPIGSLSIPKIARIIT